MREHQVTPWWWKSWPKLQLHWFGQSRKSTRWGDTKKGSCHRNDIKTMVTQYQNTKSREGGVHNEVFVGLESKNARRPVQSTVETAAPRFQKASISAEGPPNLNWKGIEFQTLSFFNQAHSLPLELSVYNSCTYGIKRGSWKKPSPVI